MAQIIRATEHSEIGIPIEDVISSNGRPQIDARVTKYFNLEYNRTQGRLLVKTGSYVGLIPINENVHVLVLPKVPLTHLSRMLRIAKADPAILRFFTRLYRFSESRSNSIIELAAPIFLDLIELAIKRGLIRQYQRIHEPSSRNLHAIDFQKSIINHWSRGRFSLASSNPELLTANINQNRILLEALFSIRNHPSFAQSGIRNRSQNMIDSIAPFVPRAQRVDLKNWSSFRTPNVKVYDLYMHLMPIAISIISNRNVELHLVGDDLNLPSLVVDIAPIFENYIRAILEIKLPRIALNVFDGNISPRSFFVGEPTENNPAKPDFIISPAGKSDIAICVADAKYKSSIKESDRYQIISHALVFDSVNCVLISPTPNEHIQSGPTTMGTVGSRARLTLWKYYIDLSSSDIEEEEEKLARFFSHFH